MGAGVAYGRGLFPTTVAPEPVDPNDCERRVGLSRSIFPDKFSPGRTRNPDWSTFFTGVIHGHWLVKGIVRMGEFL